MLRKLSIRAIAYLLTALLVVSFMPMSLIGAYNESAVEGVLVKADFAAGDSIDTGSPVIDNATIKNCGGKNSASLNSNGVGTLTYHFTDLSDIGKATVLLRGRAICGAFVDLNVKKSASDEWTKIKTLGTPNEWGADDVTMFEFSDIVKDANEFYLQLSFNDGACGDWASVNMIRIAVKANENIRTSGTIINSDFSDDGWIAEASQGKNFTDWGSRLDNSFSDGLTVLNCDVDDAEIIYHLKDIKKIDVMSAIIKIERVFNGPYFELFASKNGTDYESIAKIDNDSNKNPKIDLTEYAAGCTEVYIKLTVHDKSMGDWAILKGFEIQTIPEPEDTTANTTLLKADFAAGDSIDTGSPVIDNATIKNCGGKNSASLNSNGVGTLTYHFTDLSDIGKATLLLRGRAICGAFVDLNVKKSASDEWTKIKTLGTPNEWGADDVTMFEFSDIVKDANEFYLQLSFNDGACGDWASVNMIRIAVKANENIRTSGTIINSDFSDDGWIAEASQGKNFTDWGSRLDNSFSDGLTVLNCDVDDAEIIYHLKELDKIDTMAATLKIERVFNGPYFELYASKDGIDYDKIAKIDNDSNKSPKFILTDYAADCTEIYLKLIVHDKSMGDWAILNGFKVVSTSSESKSKEPDVGPVVTELLNVNFAGGDSIDKGNPVNDNSTIKNCGGNNSATLNNNGVGTLTYHFSGVPSVGKASTMVTGRAICGATVDVKVKALETDEWVTVKSFGSDNIDWNQNDVTILDLSQYIYDCNDFYIMLSFNDGACGDWASVSSIRVAMTPLDEIRYVRTLVNSDFTGSAWIGDVLSGSHFSDTNPAGCLSIVDAGYTRDNNVNAEIVYRFGGLAAVEKMTATINYDRKIGSETYAEVLVSSDGTSYESAYKSKLGEDISNKLVKVNLTSLTSGKTVVYIKLVIHDTQMGDWVKINGFKVESESSAAPTPEEAPGSFNLLDVNFNETGAIEIGNPETSNIAVTKNGGEGLPFGATVDSLGKGSIVYKIEQPTQFKSALLKMTGRAIIGANITVNIKVGDSWKTVGKLGGSSDWKFKNPVSFDLSKYVNGAGTFQLQFYFDDGASGDWAMLRSLKLSGTTNGIPAEGEEEEDQGTQILSVDFSKSDWESQYPIYASDNIQCSNFDGGKGIMPNIAAGENCRCDTAYIIYKVENVEPQELLLYANHRSTNATRINFQFSKDGNNFTTVQTVDRDHLDPVKPVEIDYSKSAIGCKSFYIKIEIPGNDCYDWGVITSLRLVNKKSDIVQNYLLNVDYSTNNWQTEYPYESISGLAQGQYEYSYQVFKQGLYRDGTADTGSIVYHVTGANGYNSITVLLNNRACSGAKTFIDYSLDGIVFDNLATVSSENLDFGNAYDIDLTGNLNDEDDFYLKIRIPNDGLTDWNVLASLKVLAIKGDVKTFYRLDANSNVGGRVEVTEKVESGQQATATAVPSDGYNFIGWYTTDGDLLSNDDVYYFVPTRNLTLIGRFFENYSGDGDCVLVADYNDMSMDFLNDAYDYDNITVVTDDGLKVSNKYGKVLVRSDSALEGNIIYKFENIENLKRFKAVFTGRAIEKSIIEFQVSANGNVWDTVKQFGGFLNQNQASYDSQIHERELTNYVKELDTFYVKVKFNTIGLQDWAALRSLRFIVNGTEAVENTVSESFDDGEINNIANDKSEGVLLDQNIMLNDYASKIYFLNNMCISNVENAKGDSDQGLMVMDTSQNGEVIWKFDNLKSVSKFIVSVEGRAINGAYILWRVSTDGNNWASITNGRLDSKIGTEFNLIKPAEFDITSKVENSGIVYLRAIFSATNNNSDAFLLNIKAMSEGNGTPKITNDSEDNEINGDNNQSNNAITSENKDNSDNQSKNGTLSDSNVEIPDTSDNINQSVLISLVASLCIFVVYGIKIRKKVCNQS